MPKQSNHRKSKCKAPKRKRRFGKKEDRPYQIDSTTGDILWMKLK